MTRTFHMQTFFTFESHKCYPQMLHSNVTYACYLQKFTFNLDFTNVVHETWTDTWVFQIFFAHVNDICLQNMLKMWVKHVICRCYQKWCDPETLWSWHGFSKYQKQPACFLLWMLGAQILSAKNDWFSPNRICLHTQKPAQTNTHRIASPHRSFYSQMLLHLPFSQNNLDAYLFRRRYLHAAFTDRSFYARYLSHALQLLQTEASNATWAQVWAIDKRSAREGLTSGSPAASSAQEHRRFIPCSFLLAISASTTCMHTAVHA